MDEVSIFGERERSNGEQVCAQEKRYEISVSNHVKHYGMGLYYSGDTER